jgi:histidine ammonia-lyase
MAVVLDGRSMTLEQVEAVADGASCKLSGAAKTAVRASRAVVERAIADGRQVYGVNTGFGHLARVGIADDKLDELQLNLIRSHSAGVGKPFSERTVRAILALRINCLVRGHSGLRLATVQRMCEFLDHGIHPVIPRKGSVGASGDLAPLAHLALALIGEGEVFYKGKRCTTPSALRRAGLTPLRLAAKEGLALINGTQVMSAIGTLALLKAERLCVAADVTGAMSLEALLGSHRAFDRRIHAARPQPGQVVSAANLRKLLRKSEIEKSHADCGRVQDCYSLRCIPQVHGAVRDALGYVRGVLECEINASTDNPMVFADVDRLISGGNFHGQPVSLALDHLGTATCSLASISERRIERLLNPDLSRLPAFLAHDPGLHSGFMIAHVTAAALVSENKVLAHPASVDTISTSAAKEDHVSMGAHAARKAARIVDHTGTVVGIETLCAGQALDMHSPLKAALAVEAARAALRRVIPHMKKDRVLAGDIEKSKRWIESGKLRAAAEKVCGGLR